MYSPDLYAYTVRALTYCSNSTEIGDLLNNSESQLKALSAVISATLSYILDFNMEAPLSDVVADLKFARIIFSYATYDYDTTEPIPQCRIILRNGEPKVLLTFTKEVIDEISEFPSPVVLVEILTSLFASNLLKTEQYTQVNTDELTIDKRLYELMDKFRVDIMRVVGYDYMSYLESTIKPPLPYEERYLNLLRMHYTTGFVSVGDASFLYYLN